MRFGQSTAEQEAAVATSGGSGDYMKYLRKGDNTFQIVDEYEKWTWFWEHYNPGGFPFPCTGDRDKCPGCTSSNEKMQRASRRACFNAINRGTDGNLYASVWKVPKTVAEKLKNRYDRLGTITDRPYRVTQLKNADGRYDYDIEAEPEATINMAEVVGDYRDPEEMLVEAYEQSWGSSGAVQRARQPDVHDQAARARKPSIKRSEPEPEPEEKVYSEAELRAMDTFAILDLCRKEGLGDVPDEAKTTDQIVDWMLTQVS